MALTANDLKQIKMGVSEVIEPRFLELKSDLNDLSAATNRKFFTVFSDVAAAREDLFAVKQLLNEHSFRLAQLEHRDSSGTEL